VVRRERLHDSDASGTSLGSLRVRLVRWAISPSRFYWGKFDSNVAVIPGRQEDLRQSGVSVNRRHTTMLYDGSTNR